MTALNCFWRGLEEGERKMLTPDLLKDLKAIATETDNKETE
jgi:hypothetical protein